MTTFTRNVLPAVLIAGAIVLLAILFSFNQLQPVMAGSFSSAPAFKVATTSTAVSIAGVSARILATTTANDLVPNGIRAYASICNPSTTLVHLRLDGDKPVKTGQGLVIIAAAAGYNACYEITDNRMIYLGSVQASSTSGTAVDVSVTEYVY